MADRPPLRRSVLLGLAALVLAIVAGTWRSTGPTRDYEPLGAAAASLQQRFNQDAGRVRIVMLVAPT